MNLHKILIPALLLFSYDPSPMHVHAQESSVDFSLIQNSGLLSEVPCESHSLLDLPADLFERLMKDDLFEAVVNDYAPTLKAEALYQTFLEPENFMFEKSAELLQVKQEREEQRRIQALKDAKPSRNDFLESSETEIFQLARKIEEKYGVEIDYGRDALNFWGPYCKPTSIYDSSYILDDLRIIDEELSRYPSMIFYDTLKGLNIALVSDYENMNEKDDPNYLAGSTVNGRAMQRSESEFTPNQYADWFISLRTKQTDFRRNLQHELGHILAWHVSPTYTEDSYPEFSKIYENLRHREKRFLNLSGDKMNSTYINGYQDHDVHEYLSVLYSYMTVDDEESIFQEGSFLSEQARIMKEVLESNIEDFQMPN